MPQTLQLLTTTRLARRAAAQAQWMLVSAQLATAQADFVEMQRVLLQRQAWHAQVLARCQLGAEPGLRASMLPACAALLGRDLQQLAQRREALRAANARVQTQRSALVQCEREQLRLEEWRSLLAHQAQRARVLQENLQDDGAGF
jgi:hypothetical protein